MQTQGRVVMGKILAPHGLKGCVKIVSYTDNPSTLLSYKSYATQKGELALARIERHQEPFFWVYFKDHIDRNAAESIKGLDLYVDKQDRPPLDENEYYWTDLKGLTVEDENQQHVGTVKDVHDHGAGVFLEITTPSGSIKTLPFYGDSILEISLEKKCIRCQENALL